MKARIIARDEDGGAEVYRGEHDIAVIPHVGWLLPVVVIPGYRAPIVEQCALVADGASAIVEVRCRAGRVAP